MGRLYLHSINFTMVVRVLGWLLLIESAFLLLPAGVSMVYNETDVALAFVKTFAITLSCGLLMTFAFRDKFNNSSMRKREGLLLTSVVWIVFSFFGMLPLLFTVTTETVTDAFFETMSGFTTTGASVIKDVEALPRGLVFWRSLSQWIGGMGIILFTLAVLPMLNYKGGVTLFSSEVTGITHERLRPRVNQTAKVLWGIYLVMTALLFVLLLFGPMNWFDAICHTLSTVSTGGFSTMNDGLHYWHDYYTDAVIIVFMLLCGINFSVIYGVVVQGNWKQALHNVTLRWYLGLIFFGSIAIFARVVYCHFCDTLSDSVLFSIFDTVSAITSTGFSRIDYELSGEFIFFLLLLLMFFGGMAGSTAGGAKVDRFLVAFKHVKNELFKAINVNAVTTVRLNSRAVPRGIVDKVLAFLAIYVFIIIAVAVFLTMYDMPAFDAFFNSMSMLSNIGFGYGEMTGGIDKFANLPDVCKWVLAFEMLVGRLELYTVLVVFTRSFWIKD